MLRSIEQVPAGIHSIVPPPDDKIALVAFSDLGVYWRDIGGWHEQLVPPVAGKILCCATLAGTFFVGTEQGQLWFINWNSQAGWQTIPVSDEAIIAINVNSANDDLALVNEAGHVYRISPNAGTPELTVKLPFAPAADVTVSWQKLVPAAISADAPAKFVSQSEEDASIEPTETTAVVNSQVEQPVPATNSHIALVESIPEKTPTRTARRKRKKPAKANVVPEVKSPPPVLPPVPEIKLSLQNTVNAHSGWLNGILVFAEQGFVLTAGEDGWLRRWQLSDFTLQQSWLAHVGGVVAMVDYDGESVVTTGNDCHVRLWNCATGSEQTSFVSGTAKPTALYPIQTEDSLLIADEEGNVSLWDLQNGVLVEQHRCHERMINDIGLTNSKQTLFTVSNDNAIHRYSWPSMKEDGQFAGHDDWVTVLVASRDGKLLFTGSDDQSIRSWDLSDIASSQALKGHQGWIRHLALSGDDKWLISTAFDGKLLVWDTHAGRMVSQIEFSEALGVLAWQTEELLLVGDSEGRLHQIQWTLHRLEK